MLLSKPLLQLAVDTTDIDRAEWLVEQAHEMVDIVEVGTPLLIEEGLGALERLKKLFARPKYLADLKIADAGHIEATSAFARGADIATVLGVSDDATVRGALRAAEEHGGEVMADLIHVTDLSVRARRLEALGVPIICLHTAFDRQGAGVDPLADLTAVRSAVGCRLAIAGGIGMDTVTRAIELGADIVIVGGAIGSQADPRAAAEAISAKIQEVWRSVGNG